MKSAAVDITSGAPRLAEFRWQRQQLSERRLQLRREQANAFSPELGPTLVALGSELRGLEDAERALRSRIRFESRETILKRANLEQRLLHELDGRANPALQTGG